MSRKIHLTLPSRYAEKVVESEMNLAKENNLEKFKTLIKLYIVNLKVGRNRILWSKSWWKISVL